jgi:hypothetical protein
MCPQWWSGRSWNLGDYYGSWVYGEKEGEGVMIYVNQDVYSGKEEAQKVTNTVIKP